MWGRRRPVFPTHPAQGMGWVQLVRHGWAWGNLGRLNAALGMRLTEDVEAKRPRGASTTITAVEWPPLPGYPGSQAAFPVLPGSSASGSPGKQEGIAFREAEALSSGLTHAGHQTLLRGLSDSQGRCECYTRQWMGDTLNRGAGCHPQSFCPDLLLQARSSEPALPLPVCTALSHPILASFFRKTLPLLWSTSGARCGPHIPSSSPPFSLVYATRHDTLAGSRFPPWLLSSAQSVPPYIVSFHCPGSHLCPW